jgi:hypothetical protein
MGCEAVEIGEEGAEGCQETLGGDTHEVHTLCPHNPPRHYSCHTPAEIEQMAAHQRHTTHPQPHEPLLVGWIVGGMATPHHQDHWQGRKMVMGSNDVVVIWAPGKFFFVLLIEPMNCSVKYHARLKSNQSPAGSDRVRQKGLGFNL